MRRKMNMFMALGLGLAAVVPAADASSLEEGLIAWWRMELKVGNIIPDVSGNCHDLTVLGSPAFDGSVVTFNDDGTLEAADSDALDLLGDWSISFWAREDAITGGGNGWVQKYRNFGDSEGGWFVVSDSFRLRTGIMRGPNCSYDTGGPLPHGTWTRITTTFDATTMTASIYLDDHLEFSSNIPTNPVSPCSVLPNVYPVLIGGYLESDGTTKVPDCNGAISDIRIYDRTLSDSEVAELFAMGPPGDSDGDGVPNEDDECPDSNSTGTIVISGCHTGVENRLLEEGCTMADIITECSEGVESHGAFVRCVGHLTNLWKCQGLITGEEKGAVQSCAGASEIP